MLELVDCHIHSVFSDGRDTIEAMVVTADEMGLTTVCCTDHLTLPREMDPDCEVSIPEDELALYRQAVIDARAGHPALDVVLGFEADYYPGCEEHVRTWSAGGTYLLGSVHWLDGYWIDDLSDLTYWDTVGTEEAWRRYFEVWQQACGSACAFDSMAHPDLVAILGRYPAASLMSDLYDSAAEAARAGAVHIEINTAGLTKPLGRIYPDPDLLRRFYRAGVPLTVGSDAHTCARVEDHIPDAYALAYEAGYRHVDVPTSEGSWRTLDL